MQKIGTTALWMGLLSLEERRWSVGDLQQQLTDYTRRTGNTVTAALLPVRHELLLMNWPETREGYVAQTPEICAQSLRDLADVLNAKIDEAYHLQPGKIACVMGLKVGGYDDGRIATLDELANYGDQLSMIPAHMISARAVKGSDEVESYDEPVVLLTGSEANESAVHAIGDQLEQHHYAIQRGSGATDLYETKWATQED